MQPSWKSFEDMTVKNYVSSGLIRQIKELLELPSEVNRSYKTSYVKVTSNYARGQNSCIPVTNYGAAIKACRQGDGIAAFVALGIHHGFSNLMASET